MNSLKLVSWFTSRK